MYVPISFTGTIYTKLAQSITTFRLVAISVAALEQHSFQCTASRTSSLAPSEGSDVSRTVAAQLSVNSRDYLPDLGHHQAAESRHMLD
jgi:hypothetical protein